MGDVPVIGGERHAGRTRAEVEAPLMNYAAEAPLAHERLIHRVVLLHRAHTCTCTSIQADLRTTQLKQRINRRSGDRAPPAISESTLDEEPGSRGDRKSSTSRGTAGSPCLPSRSEANPDAYPTIQAYGSSPPRRTEGADQASAPRPGRVFDVRSQKLNNHSKSRNHASQHGIASSTWADAPRNSVSMRNGARYCYTATKTRGTGASRCMSAPPTPRHDYLYTRTA